MSKYNKDVNALVRDSIHECLEIAKICIEKQKDEKGNCYGMPALILLCDVIDSIGSYFTKGFYEVLKDNFKGIGSGTHYSEFYDAFTDIMGKEINKSDFCDGSNSIVLAYRNRSVHNSGLNPNCFIVTKGEKLCEQNDDGKGIKLNIKRLYDIVAMCNEKFKKEHPISEATTEGEELFKQLAGPIDCNEITGNTV